MKFYIYLLLLLLPFDLFSQTYELKARFIDLPFKTVYLSEIFGEKYRFIDSAKADLIGTSIFHFKPNAKLGQYRLWTESKKASDNGKKSLLDFIYNKEDIEFITNSVHPADSMKIVKSEENKVYFGYLKRRNDQKYKMELLNPLLQYYPQDDDFYNVVTKKANDLMLDVDNFIDKNANNKSATYTARIMKMEKNINVDVKLNEEQKIDYMKTYYFSNTDFTDTLLMNSNAFTNKVIGYLGLYREKQSNRDKQEIAFIRAVDVIMKVANKNKKVYEFVLDYLINGFEKFDFKKVITYIADNSKIEEQCENSQSKTTLETKIEFYKKFSVGKQVPDIIINDINNKPVKLSEIQTDKVLIVFWASWCPHCKTILPEIKTIYENQKLKKFEVLTISIDDNRKDLTTYINEKQFDWINCAEFKGWEGKTIKDYSIYATPTMFLVDKNRIILAKPLSIEELRKALTN